MICEMSRTTTSLLLLVLPVTLEFLGEVAPRVSAPPARSRAARQRT